MEEEICEKIRELLGVLTFDHHRDFGSVQIHPTYGNKTFSDCCFKLYKHPEFEKMYSYLGHHLYRIEPIKRTLCPLSATEHLNPGQCVYVWEVKRVIDCIGGFKTPVLESLVVINGYGKIINFISAATPESNTQPPIEHPKETLGNKSIQPGNPKSFYSHRYVTLHFLDFRNRLCDYIVDFLQSVDQRRGELIPETADSIGMSICYDESLLLSGDHTGKCYFTNAIVSNHVVENNSQKYIVVEYFGTLRKGTCLFYNPVNAEYITPESTNLRTSTVKALKDCLLDSVSVDMIELETNSENLSRRDGTDRTAKRQRLH
jgi:hypothetical protein